MIKDNLQKLYLQAHQLVGGTNLDEVINLIIKETNDHYLSMGISNYLQDEEAIQLSNYSKNENLNELFEKAKVTNSDDPQIVAKLKKDIKASFAKIKEFQKTDPRKIQAILIEHGYHPYGTLSIHGRGDFPILTHPKNILQNFSNNIMGDLGDLDYSLIWFRIYEMEEVFEELEYGELILDSELFQSVERLTKLRTAILVNQAFEEMGIELFEEISIETPVHIYMGGHDTNQLSIHQIF
jgi:hypothetical protein